MPRAGAGEPAERGACPPAALLAEVDCRTAVEDHAAVHTGGAAYLLLGQVADGREWGEGLAHDPYFAVQPGTLPPAFAGHLGRFAGSVTRMPADAPGGYS